MPGQIQKWGNSLAIRIPKRLADELSWDQNTLVEERIIDGKLVIEAVKRPRPTYTLAQLLEGMTPDHLHGEIQTGKAIGKEEDW